MKKIINCWSATQENKRRDISPGDIIVISSENNRKIEIIKDFKWYFLVENSDKSILYLNHLLKFKKINSFEIKENFIKVFIDKKYYKEKSIIDLVSYLESNLIRTYEADVGPAKRYLLDSEFEIEDIDNINLFYFDIETDDSEGKIEYFLKNDFSVVKAKDRILSISFVCKKTGETFFLHDSDERRLLHKINTFLRNKKVDMLVGYNSSNYDMPYIFQRMDLHDVDSHYIKNILHEDLQKRLMYFYSKDPDARKNLTSYSLNNISKYFLNEEKIKHEGKVIELMKNDFEKFKEYNIKDSVLLYRLEEKLGLISLTYKMFQMCHCTPSNWSMVKAIDNMILYEANQKNIHYSTNKNYYEDIPEQIQYLGAFVLPPIPGYYENVYVFDFKSLYPNIIRTFNISPDSFLDKKIEDCIETPGIDKKGNNFYQKKEGVIPFKIKSLLDERTNIRNKQKKYDKSTEEWRDLNVKQLIVKELANSIYGVLGNKYFRSFNIKIAESITGTGQYLLKLTQSILEEKGRKVIYGDTDSVFVILNENEDPNEVVKETNKQIEIHLKEKYNIIESYLELDVDKHFIKFLIETKKKYVGLINDKYKYTGLECVKRDTIKIASKMQKELIETIFNKENLTEFIERKRKEFNETDYHKDLLSISKAVGKNLNEYKPKKDGKKYTAPLHVRMIKGSLSTDSEKDNVKGKGEIVSYIITNDAPLEGVLYDNYEKGYSREYYWNKLIYPIMQRLLEIVEPEVNWNRYIINYKEKINANQQKLF